MAETVSPSESSGGVPVFEDISLRERTWLEQRLGPENYRLVMGLLHNPLSIAGMILLTLFVLIAVLAPVLAPLPPGRAGDFDLGGWLLKTVPRDGFHPTPKPPMTVWNVRPPPLPFWWQTVMGTDQWVHLMGTASGQWDIYYGLVWGTRTAFFVGIFITSFTLAIGLLVGSISGYYGGRVDDVLMRFTEIFMAFPFLLAALTLSALLAKQGKSIWPATIALIVFGWMGYARLMRGDILATKERDYVLAARTIGVRDSGILARHIIPNAVYPTLVVASLDVGAYVISFAALSFLGVGTEVGYPDWGQIIAFARSWISRLADYWYIVLYPGVMLILFGLAWNLVGDAIRDVMDPRMKGRGV